MCMFTWYIKSINLKYILWIIFYIFYVFFIFSHICNKILMIKYVNEGSNYTAYSLNIAAFIKSYFVNLLVKSLISHLIAISLFSQKVIQNSPLTWTLPCLIPLSLATSLLCEASSILLDSTTEVYAYYPGRELRDMKDIKYYKYFYFQPRWRHR